MATRTKFTDETWEDFAVTIKKVIGRSNRSSRNDRKFIEAILWIARTGAPWRDLPREFGRWNSIFQRFRRWSKKGIWERLKDGMRGVADAKTLIVCLDSTIVRAHQHAAGAKGGNQVKH